MTEHNEQNEQKNTSTFTEQFEVAGSQLVEKIKELVEEGNVRRIILRAPDDKVMMEITLTAATIAGGAVALAAPWLAAIGAAAALVTKMRVEIVRETDDVPQPPERLVKPEKASSTGTQKVKIEVED